MSYNREARKILYEAAYQMAHWDDTTLEYYFDKPAAKARKSLIKVCNDLAAAERERKLREFEENLPF